MRIYCSSTLILLGMTLPAFDLSPAMAQSGGTSRGTTQSQATSQSGSAASRPLAPQEFYQSFWKYLNNPSNPYQKWSSWPGKPGIYQGQSPHGAFLKMYVNGTAAANINGLPAKSVIVKENYGPDKKTLMAVTVMYRVPGYDPGNKDWYWIKYQPNGKVAQTPPEMGSMPIAGKFKSCIECHHGADGDDLVFAND